MTPDQLSQLERLSQLLKEGVLTEAEFNQAKQRLLTAENQPMPSESNSAVSDQPPVQIPDPPKDLVPSQASGKNESVSRLIVIAILVAVGGLFLSWLIQTNRDPYASKYESDSVAVPADDSANNAVTRAEEEKTKQEAAATFKRLKPLLTIRKDEFSGTWYHNSTAPKYANANGFDVYFHYSDGLPGPLYWRIQYYAEDWLFIESLTFLIDGRSYEYVPTKMERDNKDGIWEWFNEEVDDSAKAILDAMVLAKTVKVRFHGKQYHADRIITPKERKSIKNIMDARQALIEI